MIFYLKKLCFQQLPNCNSGKDSYQYLIRYEMNVECRNTPKDLYGFLNFETPECIHFDLVFEMLALNYWISCVFEKNLGDIDQN